MKLNNITYQFDTQTSEKSLSIGETEPYYKKCLNSGLTSLSANTVSQMANNMLKNMDENTKITPEQLMESFVKDAKFFEYAVIREQLYRLYSIKLSVQAELDQLEARHEEILQLEHNR